MRLITIALLLLVGCSSSNYDVGATVTTWNGVAFEKHAYQGRCIASIRAKEGDGAPLGLFLPPDTIYILDDICNGGRYQLWGLRDVLAHEVAHMIVCGQDEPCAERQGRTWVDKGVTLAQLGWPQ